MRQNQRYFPNEPSVDVSLVVAIFNEEDSLEQLFSELNEIFSGLGVSWELIFVDDGSTDGSLEKLTAHIGVIPNLRVVELYRNVGQVSALSAGMSAARGRKIIMMDGDLQHDPADIPKFLKNSDEGCDLVASYRMQRQEKVLRKIFTWVGNPINRYLTNISIKDFGSAYRLFDARILEAMRDRDGYFHYNTPDLYQNARKLVEIPIVQRRRKYGASKWTFEEFIWFNMDFLAASTNLAKLLIFLCVSGLLIGILLYVFKLIGVVDNVTAISAPVSIIFTSVIIGILAMIWRETVRTQKLLRGEPPFLIHAIWSDGVAEMDDSLSDVRDDSIAPSGS